jgi:hypothetical protein
MNMTPIKINSNLKTFGKNLKTTKRMSDYGYIQKVVVLVDYCNNNLVVAVSSNIPLYRPMQGSRRL